MCISHNAKNTTIFSPVTGKLDSLTLVWQSTLEKKNLEFKSVTFRKLTLLLGLFGLVWFHGIPTLVGYLMPNPLYTYILNIYDLDLLGFMAYQPL